MDATYSAQPGNIAEQPAGLYDRFGLAVAGWAGYVFNNNNGPRPKTVTLEECVFRNIRSPFLWSTVNHALINSTSLPKDELVTHEYLCFHELTPEHRP